MYRQLLSHPFRRYSSNSDPAKPQPYQPQQTRKPTSHETQQSGKASTGVGLGSINKYAVDMLSARRGLPSEAGRKASEKVVREGELPAKYRPAARKITLAMVALPIAIVTGYVLYQRLILGKERKHLIRD